MRLNTVGLTLMLALTILVAPLAADTQRPAKVPRIGFLGVLPPSAVAARTEAFRQGLRELGYVEGKNIVIEPTLSNPTQEKFDISGILFVQRAEESFFVGR